MFVIKAVVRNVSETLGRNGMNSKSLVNDAKNGQSAKVPSHGQPLWKNQKENILIPTR